MPFVNTNLSGLPELDSASRDHLRQVLDSIQTLIEAHDGFIGFDQYMSHVLYAPGLGYYSSGTTKFGAAGDYVTAPMISNLFSRTLARWLAPQLVEDRMILELGAGEGVMAADILLELEALHCLPEQYLILELSADLRARQQQYLQIHAPHLVDRVQWLDTLDHNNSFSGIIIGNEVLDAMPVKRFEMRSGQLHELGVGWDKQTGPVWQTKAADQTLIKLFQQHISVAAEWPETYCSELNPVIDGWFTMLAGFLKEGVVLLLDYGHSASEYYHPQRSSGTLRCYYRHHVLDDPFYLPGLIDITAWVDFTAVASAADDAGFTLAGYTTQANFLLDAGLPSLMQTATDDSLVEQLQQAEAVKQLMMPGEMGDSVKVIALSKGNSQFTTGFIRDIRYQL